MNEYIGEVRKRGQNLLIVEGKHEKDELFKLLFRCFPEMRISAQDIWIYGTNIYVLYDDIVKEYGEQWEKDDIDLPFVISKKQGGIPLRYKDDFTNIILVFDYERQDTNFSEDKIVCMQNYFMDATDTGKLYINYPMIESYQHLCSLPDGNYFNRTIPVSLQPGKKYKSLVKKQSVIKKLIKFPDRVDDLLKEHYQIIDDEKRKEFSEKIFALKSEEDMREKICDYLSGIINEMYTDTAAYQLENMIQNIEYAKTGENYWSYMRGIFKQIIRHNIFKAFKVQFNSDMKNDKKYRDIFEKIDLKKILNIQNTASRSYETGFIWVLCTCVFLVPEYNFALVL